MDKFTQQYLETMLWAENDGDHPLDSKYSVEDISEELKNKAQKDCDEFRKKAGDLLDSLEDTQVAHDFWLTMAVKEPEVFKAQKKQMFHVMRRREN